MRIQLEDDSCVNGSLIVDAVLRTALEPVPLTFEGEFVLTEGIAPYLLEGKELKVGSYQSPVTIKKVVDRVGSLYREGAVTVRRVIAVYSPLHEVIHVLGRGVFLENTSLTEIYKACGGKCAVEQDVAVSKFYALRGEIPAYAIACVLAEHGGVIRLSVESASPVFTRINDLFAQEPKRGGDKNFSENTQKSGTLEHCEAAIWLAADETGTVRPGKGRRRLKVAHDKTPGELNAMSRVLLNAKNLSLAFSPDINAGDLIRLSGRDFVVLTAAHRFGQVEGRGEHSVSRFWLGVREEES